MLCPSCGERNADRARFCLRRCVRLGVSIRTDEGRKVVTVLSCDLVAGGTLDEFVGDGVLVREADGLLGDAAAAPS